MEWGLSEVGIGGVVGCRVRGGGKGGVVWRRGGGG